MIPGWSSSASSVTARRRPDRWPTSWHSNRFVDPVHDGAVLPILHLNGYKISNPTVLARIPHARAARPCSWATATSRCSWRATTRPRCTSSWRRPWTRRSTTSPPSSGWRGPAARRADPAWPMIILRSPKGWTGPKEVDGLPAEGSFRSHQVPLADVRERPEHLAHAGGVAAQLPTRRAVRRGRPPRAVASGAGAGRATGA